MSKKRKLPLSTWTRTLAKTPFDGSHWYIPESVGRAFRIKRLDVVVSSLRVITVIPPRADSYEIICVWIGCGVRDAEFGRVGAGVDGIGRTMKRRATVKNENCLNEIPFFFVRKRKTVRAYHVVVGPNDERRRFGWFANGTRQVYGWTTFNV